MLNINDLLHVNFTLNFIHMDKVRCELLTDFVQYGILYTQIIDFIQ